MKLYNTFIIIILVSFVLVVAGCSTQVSTPNTNTPVTPGNTPIPTIKKVDMNNTNKSVAEQTQATVAALVPDGDYTKDVSYRYHSGTETVTISVTIKDDVVTAATVTGNNPNRQSARYISAVNAALPSLVVGKRIDQINIPHQVSGSSLTSAAVKQYLNGLMQQ